MAERKKLGDVLKEAGLIDDFQLQSALSHQKNWGGKLGAILVELEFVREEDIAKVIADKLRIPYVNLFEPELPKDVTKHLKHDIVKKYNVMPVRREGNALVLAMADPMDIEVMDEVRFITGLMIKPVLAMGSEIRDAIKKYYEGGDVVRRTLPPFRETGGRSQPMELVHEVPEAVEPERMFNVQKEAPSREAPDTQKLILESVVSLLIEKGLITRDELMGMIEQKKMGL